MKKNSKKELHFVITYKTRWVLLFKIHFLNIKNIIPRFYIENDNR